MKQLLPLAALLIAAAGPPQADPDWPCVQRLVPTLSAATVWPGHDTSADWHADPALAAAVTAITPRTRPIEAATAQLQAYVATVPPPDRRTTLPTLMAGLVDETNTQRTSLIDRLREIARRQRALTEVTGRLSEQLRARAPDRPDLQDRRRLLIREYEEINRTIRYACEAPTDLERRLGQFATILQQSLPE